MWWDEPETCKYIKLVVCHETPLLAGQLIDTWAYCGAFVYRWRGGDLADQKEDHPEVRGGCRGTDWHAPAPAPPSHTPTWVSRGQPTCREYQQK